MNPNKKLLFALVLGISGFAEDWRYVGLGPDREKNYYDLDPKLIQLGKSKCVAIYSKCIIGDRFYVITITYLRPSKAGWEYAPKSQFEYNMDGSIKNDYIQTKDSELYWSEWEFQPNEINNIRLARARALLQGHH